MIIQLLPVLATQLPLDRLLQHTLDAIQLGPSRLLRRPLIRLALEPRPLRPRPDLRRVHHHVLALAQLHLRLRKLLVLLLLLQDLHDLLRHPVHTRRVRVRLARLDHPRRDLGACCTRRLDRGLDDLAVWFGGEGAGATRAAGTSCAADSVKVDLEGLWCFVVDDDFDALDIQTTGREIGTQQERDLAVAESFDRGDTLGI